ncbi:MAG: DUF362 domain-containing protein [Deltaproteobacteria bacterium]|nr:DUF362 domain-containing protein [Deltaproteobacteria bacterium]
MKSDSIDRRDFLVGTAAGASALAWAQTSEAQSRGPAAAATFAATRPAGFTPMTAPGRVVRVAKPGSLRRGGLYPQPEAAAQMVERALKELTGESTLAGAWRKFVHPSDIVGVKVNGLGLRNMASNKEVVYAIVQGVIAAGVPAANIVVYDQFQGFLNATRVQRSELPTGVRTAYHANTEVGAETRAHNQRTAYARVLLGCTAIIGVPLVKDHSLSGFTGALKNMTHGSIKNPEDFHRNRDGLNSRNRHIPELYAHDAIKSRMRLHVMDAFKVLYDRGPQDNPAARVPYERVMVSTDPVALDVIGTEIVDQFRTQNHMRTLERSGRGVRYLEHAATLGLGVADRARIQLVDVAMT